MSSDFIMNHTKYMPAGTIGQELVGRGGHGGGHGGWHGGRGRRFFYGGDWGYPYYWDGGYGWPYDAGDVNVYVLPPGQAQGAPNMQTFDPYTMMESAPPAAYPQLPPSAAELKAAGTIPASFTRCGELAQMAPVLAPASNGYSFRIDLDRNGQLIAAICIDGKCHVASYDMRPVMADVMAKFAQIHQGMHAQMQPTTVGAEALVGAEMEAQVAECGRALVRGLLERHIDTASAGFFDDITGAIKGAVNSVSNVASSAVGTIGHTLSALKGPISEAASYAAGAAAAAIPGVGPLVAPMAKNLADQLVKAATGDQNAKQAVAQAKQQAKTDPNVALALKKAHDAVAHATAHTHVTHMVKRAAIGDVNAARQVQQISTAAQQGDPAAQAAMSSAQQGTDAALQAIQSATDWLPGDLSSAISDDAAQAAEATVSGVLPMVLFVSAALAGVAYWAYERTKRLAAKATETAVKADATPPGPEKDALIKKTVDITETVKKEAPPAGGGSMPWGMVDPIAAAQAAQAAQAQAIASGAFVGTGGPRQIILGASPAIGAIRAEAAQIAKNQPEQVNGVMRKENGHYVIMPFTSSDDADDWMGRQDPADYVYIAYYDKGSMSFLQNENIGTAGQGAHVASNDSIHRGIATTQGWM